MVDREALSRAMDELYSVEPEEFLARRSALAAAARTAGDRATAKEITGLRKPTRSAAILNGLARSDPDRITALLDLGAELRDAERSVDARRLRELTGRRRRLIDEVTGAAFRTARDPDPSASIRDEVVSTLTAALADDAVAEQLREGTLVKAARWEGFGFGSGPDLMILPSGDNESDAGARSVATQAVSGRAMVGAAKPENAGPDEVEPDAAGGGRAGTDDRRQAKDQARRDARARAEQDRREAIADARHLAEEADAALADARQDEQEQHDRLRMLEEQVVDARRRLDDSRLAVRRAEVQQRKAAHALSRVDR